MKFPRLLPLVATLSIIALVAACARHEKNPTIKDETMEQQAVASIRKTFGDVNIYDETDMKFSAEIEGAELKLNKEVGKDAAAHTRALDADVTIAIKDHEIPLIGKGIISHEAPTEMIHNDEAGEYKILARCVAKDCANVIVQLTRFELKPSTALPTPDAEKKEVDEKDLSGATQNQAEGTSEVPADAKAEVIGSALKPGPKVYLQFRIPMKDKNAKEDEKIRTLRQADFSLFWSTPKAKGQIKSGTTLSAKAALKARTDKKSDAKDKAPAPTDTPPVDTANSGPATEEAEKKANEEAAKVDEEKAAQKNEQEETDKDKSNSKSEDVAKYQSGSQDQNQAGDIVVTVSRADVAKSQLAYAEELEAKAAKEKDAKKKEALLAEAKVWREKAAQSQAKADAKK